MSSLRRARAPLRARDLTRSSPSVATSVGGLVPIQAAYAASLVLTTIQSASGRDERAPPKAAGTVVFAKASRRAAHAGFAPFPSGKGRPASTRASGSFAA